MAAEYNRVVVGGSLPGGEVWSVNPGFGGPTAEGGAVTDFAELQSWADAIATGTPPVFLDNAILELISQVGTIEQVRTEAYTAAGVLIGAAVAGVQPPLTGSDAIRLPQQSAVVASLGTGRPGRSYNGRIFWPALNVTVASGTGRLTTADATAIATATADFLLGIAGAAPSGAALRPVVVSHKLQIQTPITVVRVGDVIDTQRRRRDALIEAYSSSPLQS